MTDSFVARLERAHIDAYPRDIRTPEDGDRFLYLKIPCRHHDSEPEYQQAPFELLIYTDQSNTVRYTVSVDDSVSEEPILEWFSYLDTEFKPTKTFDDILPHFPTEEDVQLFSIRPEEETTREEKERNPGAGRDFIPRERTYDELEYADPGETVASLANRANRTGAYWAVQSLGWGDRLELRLALWKSDGSALSTKSLDRFSSPFQLGTSQLDFVASREPDLYHRFKTAYAGMGFEVPKAFFPGLGLPPGRLRALRAGLGGIRSALDQAPRPAIYYLTNSDLILGWELNAHLIEGSVKPTTGKLKSINLPHTPQSIYRVFRQDIGRQVCNLALHQYLQHSEPTIVIATDPGVINAARRVHESYYDDIDRKDADEHLEYVDFVAVEEFIKDSSTNKIKRWFRRWITEGTEMTYLFDLSGISEPTEGVSHLLLMLSNVANKLPAPKGTVWADLILSTSGLIHPDNPALSEVLGSLDHAPATHFLIDLQDRIPESLPRKAVARTGRVANTTLLGPALNDKFQVQDFITSETVYGSREDSMRDWHFTKSNDSSKFPSRHGWWYGVFDLPVEAATVFGMPFQGRPFNNPLVDVWETGGSKRRNDSILGQLSTLSLPDEPPESNSSSSASFHHNYSDSQTGSGHVPREFGLPKTVEYDQANNCYKCLVCERDSESVAHARYDLTNEGLIRAIQCHSSLAKVDRAQIRQMPHFSLKLDPQELDELGLSESQYQLLRGLNAVQRGNIDHRLEYDPIVDSAAQVRDDYELDQSAIEELVTKGYISVDTTPHLVYNLTERGRQAIGERKQLGRDVGPGIAELSESIWHRMGRRALSERLQTQFAEKDGFTVEMIAPIEENYENTKDTLDDVVRAPDGRIVVGGEIERSNNDDKESYVRSYEKLAQADPETALWVVENTKAAYQMADYLSQAAIRGEIEYSGGSHNYTEDKRIHHLDIDDEYVTEVLTMQQLIRDVDPAWRTAFSGS